MKKKSQITVDGVLEINFANHHFYKFISEQAVDNDDLVAVWNMDCNAFKNLSGNL